MTKVSLLDGEIVTSVLEKELGRFSGAGLSPDGAGHLWIAYSHVVVRVDETTGAVDRWALPEISAQELGSDNPSAGNAQAAAWDTDSQSLLFVRNFDHRLYRLSPTDGLVTTVQDLGVITTTLSSIAISDDGALGVTGSASSTAYAPVAAIVTRQPGVIPDFSAVCFTSLQLVALGTDGSVTSLATGQAKFVASIPVPRGRSLFACRDGNIFQAAAADGQITLHRISLQGDVVELIVPLIGAGGLTSISGKDITSAWIDPGVQALVPDQRGGVWLVTMSGTQDIAGGVQSYPSLLHLSFER